MGNTPSPTKKRRVTFAHDVGIDRYEESTRRYEHIMKVYSALDRDDMDQKDKLSALIVAYLNRCHGHTNMTCETVHYDRVKTIAIIGLEVFQGSVTEQQVPALLHCLIEYVLLLNV